MNDAEKVALAQLAAEVTAARNDATAARADLTVAQARIAELEAQIAAAVHTEPDAHAS